MITAINGQSGAGMMYGWGTAPALLSHPQPRMSELARRFLQYRFWWDGLMAHPQNSEYFERDLMRTESSLRDQAAFIIGWGC